MKYYELDFEWDWDYNPEEVEEVWDKYYDWEGFKLWLRRF